MSKVTLEDVLVTRRSLPPSSDDEVAYIVEGSGPDGTFVPGVDDLRDNIKTTLGDYLSALTSEGKNYYAIDGGITETGLSDSNGDPTALGQTNNSQVFTTDLESWVSNFLDSNSELRTSDYLSKGRPARTSTDTGNTLLPKVTGVSLGEGSSGRASSQTEGDTPVEKQISQVLRSNRFNPTPGNSPFVENGAVPSVGGTFRSVMGTSAGGTDVSVDAMKKVGASLLLMGAGDSGESDPDSSAGLFLGQGVQLGVNRIPQLNLSVRQTNPMRGLGRVNLESDVVGDGGDPEYYSYGHVNTPTSPFDGFVPLGMIALGTLMTTTMIVGAEVIFGILALIVNTDGKSVRMDPGPYIMGQYGKPEADGLLSTLIGPEALGLIHTENDFFDCARRGANVFFGFSGDDLSSAAETALLNLVQAPGYYVVIVRNILRSLNTISNSFRDIDFSNPISGAQAVLGIMDVIKSSKIVSFFNVCAALGDVLITEEMRGNVSQPGQKSANSLIDSFDDRPLTDGSLPEGVVQTPGLSVMKSRSRSGTSSLSLAWRSSASPAMYVLPKGIIDASLKFGSNSSVAKGLLASYHQSKFRVTEGSRLASEDVKAMEDALESEYVPFYFHDLRTNEIVSLHAFLKTLTDSYAPSYEQVDGYGRIDSVNIYKSTKRSIEFSFFMASTSEDDFDELWWKINKLTTLLYPQWGSGRSLESSATGAKFTQPFSQVPTASPLIRLRIGDVVKSNFSKFNMSRIFGFGGTDTFSPSSKFEGADFKPETVEAIKIVVAPMMTDPDLSGFEKDGFFPNDLAILRPTLGGYYMEATPTGNLLSKAAAVLSKGSARRRVRIPVETPVVVTARSPKQLDRTKLNIQNEAKTIYTVSFAEEIPGVTTEGITEVEVTHADLKIDPSYVLTKSKVFTEEEVESITPTEISDFFSPENNYVMRSFETVAGRGLAGVITNMSFDWVTPTWETSVGRRAPKYVEVNVSFSPIHDIPPGLDDSGFNRAPVYNVGGMVNKVAGDVYDRNVDEIDLMVRQLYLKFAAGTLSAAKSTT